MPVTIYLPSAQYVVDESASAVLSKLTANKGNGWASLNRQANGLYAIDTTFNNSRSFFFNVNQVQDIRVT